MQDLAKISEPHVRRFHQFQNLGTSRALSTLLGKISDPDVRRIQNLRT